jgi:uncharacterized protein YndB with AHSA1/START domain
MPRVDNEVIINAPVEKIFQYISQPSNLLQIWPSLIEISNEKLLSNGGYNYRWTYKMAGIHFKGEGKCIDLKPNLILVSKNKGAIDSIVSFTFLSTGIQTKVTLSIEYVVPLPLFNRFTEIIILKMNEKEAELILDNLRIVLEKTGNR